MDHQMDHGNGFFLKTKKFHLITFMQSGQRILILSVNLNQDWPFFSLFFSFLFLFWVKFMCFRAKDQLDEYKY